MKIHVVFATEMEAQVFCERCMIPPGTGIYCTQYSQVSPVVCGMGILNAARCVATLPDECQEIWNYGFAGALSDSYSEGEIITIGRVGKHLSLPSDIDDYSAELGGRVFPSVDLLEMGWRLLSSDYPIHRKQQRDELAADWDLVDMEGYGLAWGAHRINKRCVIKKVVSDFADGGGRESIYASAARYSALLADQIFADLKALDAEYDEMNSDYWDTYKDPF